MIRCSTRENSFLHKADELPGMVKMIGTFPGLVNEFLGSELRIHSIKAL
jgi:hypothetical protein